MKIKLTNCISFLSLLFLISCGSETFEERVFGVWDIERQIWDCENPIDNDTYNYVDGCTTEDGERYCRYLTISSRSATLTDEFGSDITNQDFDTVTLNDVDETITLCSNGECTTSKAIVDGKLEITFDTGDCMIQLNFNKR